MFQKRNAKLLMKKYAILNAKNFEIRHAILVMKVTIEFLKWILLNICIVPQKSLVKHYTMEKSKGTFVFHNAFLGFMKMKKVFVKNVKKIGFLSLF